MRSVFLSILFGMTLSANTVIGDLGSGSPAHALGNRFIGQVFTVPTPDNILDTWQFSVAGFVAGQGTTTDISVIIADYPGLTSGITSHYGTSVPWPATTSVVTLSGLNLALNSGQTYVTIYDIGNYSGLTIGFYGSNLYAGGQGLFGQSFAGLETSAPGFANLDTDFAATFLGTTASPVPEPSFFPILLLSALAAGCKQRLDKQRRGRQSA